MSDHGPLAVSGHEDLGVRTLGGCLVDELGRDYTTWLALRCIACDICSVIDTLERDLIGEDALQITQEGWANRGSNVTWLGSSASVDDSYGLARAIEETIGRGTG